jgi:hypothetical protein
MPHVELTRPLEEYFAFAELDRHGRNRHDHGHEDTRRFTITLPYLTNQQLGRLQWWWRITLTEQSLIGEAGMAARRMREIERFCRHIERWLMNTGQRLSGEGPIPELGVVPAPAQPGSKQEKPEETPPRASKLANG